MFLVWYPDLTRVTLDAYHTVTMPTARILHTMHSYIYIHSQLCSFFVPTNNANVVQENNVKLPAPHNAQIWQSFSLKVIMHNEKSRLEELNNNDTCNSAYINILNRPVSRRIFLLLLYKFKTFVHSKIGSNLSSWGSFWCSISPLTMTMDLRVTILAQTFSC